MHTAVHTPFVRATGHPSNSSPHVAKRYIKGRIRSPECRRCPSFDPLGAGRFIGDASYLQSSSRKMTGSVQVEAVAAAAAAAPVLGVGVQWVLAASACLASLSFAVFIIATLPTLLVGA